MLELEYIEILDKILINNDNNLINIILNYIRCEECDKLEDECKCKKCLDCLKLIKCCKCVKCCKCEHRISRNIDRYVRKLAKKGLTFRWRDIVCKYCIYWEEFMD